ncbi:MAG TPA: hypothetical protein VLS49_03360 [Usitatibacter sp.]|nr:hypothetical protein [Usitatibacter sp.]
MCPHLQMTPPARAALENKLARSSVDEPRATILWVSGGGRGAIDPATGKLRAEPMRPPGWHVAVYDGAGLPESQKCELEGLPFCFVQGDTARRLDGATLDWANGSFLVREPAG